MTASLRTRVLAEAAGTFVLVLVGPGAMMLDVRTHGAVGPLGVALAFGVAVAAAILLFGARSGAHINPAVTLGLAAARRFRVGEVPVYVVAQLIGATLAAGVLRLVLGPIGHLGATLPMAGVWPSAGLELLMSFALMLAILMAVQGKWGPVSSGVTIGAVVGLCAFFGGPYTGASMNPARSFGPALTGGEWAGHWIYWAAPIAGMLGAATAWRHFSLPRAGDTRRPTP